MDEIIDPLITKFCNFYNKNLNPGETINEFLYRIANEFQKLDFEKLKSSYDLLNCNKKSYENLFLEFIRSFEKHKFSFSDEDLENFLQNYKEYYIDFFKLLPNDMLIRNNDLIVTYSIKHVDKLDYYKSLTVLLQFMLNSQLTFTTCEHINSLFNIYRNTFEKNTIMHIINLVGDKFNLLIENNEQLKEKNSSHVNSFVSVYKNPINIEFRKLLKQKEKINFSDVHNIDEFYKLDVVNKDQYYYDATKIFSCISNWMSDLYTLQSKGIFVKNANSLCDMYKHILNNLDDKNSFKIFSLIDNDCVFDDSSFNDNDSIVSLQSVQFQNTNEELNNTLTGTDKIFIIAFVTIIGHIVYIDYLVSNPYNRENHKKLAKKMIYAIANYFKDDDEISEINLCAKNLKLANYYSEVCGFKLDQFKFSVYPSLKIEIKDINFKEQ